MERLLLSCVVLLVMLAVAPAANAQGVTTLYSSLDGERTVTGPDSVPVGPSHLGHFEAAMAFTPTASGTAQLISLRQRCVIPYPTNTVCYGIGEVSIQEDAGGKPSGRSLGTSGFYLADSLSVRQNLVLSGAPTGGTFVFTYPCGECTAEQFQSAELPVNPSNQQISDALNGMLGIQRIGGVRVEGGPLRTRPVGIAFNGASARPHLLQAHALNFTGGVNPKLTISAQPVRESCGTLSPAPQLVAGRKYWAVVTSDDALGWDAWTNDKAEVLQTVDGGAWTPSFNPKRLALRVDSGMNDCVPVALTNPAAGTEIADMYVRNGARAFGAPIELENAGVAPLTWSGASFTGPDAHVFAVVDAGHQGFRFPRQIGVGDKQQINVTCSGDARNTTYRSTLRLETNDPQRPVIEFPVVCMADNEPPRLTFLPPAPGPNGWHRRHTTTFVTAVDPSPSSGVVSTTCTRSGESWSTQTDKVEVRMTAEGAGDLRCTASDLAGNVADPSSWQFKIDTQRPVTRAVHEPAPNADGWNRTPTTVRFECTDAEPGSGVDAPAGGGTVRADTSGTDFRSPECVDAAGNAATPAAETVRLDMTAPVIRAAGVTPAPNAAGWHRTDVTVGFACAEAGAVRSGIRADTVAAVRVTAEGTRTIDSEGTCVDKADNQAQPGRQQVRIDRTEPETTVESGPAAATSATGADLAFAGHDEGSGPAGYECSTDGEAYTPCTGPERLTGLADGEHVFSVRALDAAGNVDGTPASRRWTVDTIAPETEVASAPPELLRSTTAEFAFRAVAGGGTEIAGYECRLDDAAWDPCRERYGDLAQGAHRLEARARDAAGNVDPTPVTVAWTVAVEPAASAPAGGQPILTLARAERCTGAVRLTVRGSGSVSGSSSSRRVELAISGRTVTISRKRGLRRATVTLRVADGGHTVDIPVRLAVGTGGGDHMRGTRGTDLLFGLGGRDVIAGGGGDDLVCGGGGNDVLRGNGGADQLFGGAGDDTLRGGRRGDLFATGPGNDRLADFSARQGDRRLRTR